MTKCKKLISILLIVLLVAGAVNAAPVTAFAADSDIVPSGLCLEDADDAVTTVISFENGGSCTADGVIDLTATEKNAIIERIDSYEVRYADTPVITVEPKDIVATGSAQEMVNGYYAVTFAIPETTKECFLTGLTPRNVELTQENLISHYADETDFSIEDLDYVDAEKVEPGHGDDNLCWAGAASNMLQYSGWAKQAGYASEDDILDLYAEYFVDEGGSTPYGIEWFFSGIINKGMKVPDSFPGTLPEYDVNSLVSGYISLTDDVCSDISGLISSLKQKYAVQLGLEWTISGGRHAETAWGVITDNAYGEDELEHYDSIIVSDSDNNRPQGTDRRVAPNTLDIYDLNEYHDDEYEKALSFVEFGATGVLVDYTTLAPYSDSVPKETNPKATLDHLHDPDLVIRELQFSSYPYPETEKVGKVAEGDAYIIAHVYNQGKGEAKGTVQLDVVIRGADGETVQAFSDHQKISAIYDQEDRLVIELPQPLRKGAYTAEVTVNADGNLSEALLVNNHFSTDFSVVESPFDLSSISLTAEVGEYNAGQITADLDYHGLQDTELYRQCDDVALLIGYYSDGEWKDYLKTTSVSESGALPEHYQLDTYASQVRFALMLQKDGLSAIAESPEYPMSAPVITVKETVNNVRRPKVVAYDANSLADGEQFAFTLANNSTGDYGTISVDYDVIAFEHETKSTVTLIEPTSITLAPGEASGEITISSWPYSGEHSGIYSVFVRYSFSDYGGYNNELSIGRLTFSEKPDTVVTTSKDVVDPADYAISLREAVAYSELTGTDISFRKGLNRVELKQPIEVNTDVVIDGLTSYEFGDETYTNISGIKASGLFSVADSGRLTIRHVMLFTTSSDPDGSVLRIDGGTVDISDSWFNFIDNCGEGGLIRANGGSLTVKNCTFSSSGCDGSAVCIDGGAQAEMLNCMFYNVNGDKEVILNKDGRLNIINSMFTCSTSGNKSAAVIRALGETDIINSILLGNMVFKDVDGKARLYSTAYSAIGANVIADETSGQYEIADICVMNPHANAPDIRSYSYLFKYPLLTSGALNGSLVSEEDGVICLSTDGESYESIGIETAFTAEELSHDIAGRERRTIFGPYSMLDSEYYLGDTNLDEVVEIIDATMIQRYAAHFFNLTDKALLAADVDKDGEASVLDATWIQRYVAQMKAPEGIGKLVETVQ